MKRFTETQKWNDAWFRRLEPRLKLLWGWICDNCDGAGVIEPDYDLASFQIGAEVSQDDLSAFGDRVSRINGSKVWIVKFIPFQYGVLTEVCRAHLPVLRLVEKHKLLNRVSLPYQDSKEEEHNRVSIVHPKGMDTLKEKEKEQEEEKKTDAIPKSPEAVGVANLFSRRLTTAWAEREIKAFRECVKRGVLTVDTIARVADYYAAERAKGDKGIHRRDLATFLNNFDGELDRADAFAASKQSEKPAYQEVV